MKPVIVPLKTERKFLVTEELSLRFKLRCDAGARSPDERGALRTLVFHPDNGWQGLCWARQIDENLFQVTFPTPPSGDCYLFFSWAGSGEGGMNLPYLVIQGGTENPTEGVCRIAPLVHEC